MFDCLIIGGGVSGVSCALVLGSARKKAFVADKKIGIIAHQKSSMLQDALFNNAYGLAPGTLGSDLLHQTLNNLSFLYPEIVQIGNEKVVSIIKQGAHFLVTTNENIYETKLIVVAINSSNPFTIDGFLQNYVISHQKSLPQKNRLQLQNTDHLVMENVYVAGTLAGHRSQLAIAAGSGAAVATDILTLWNNGVETHAHDSVKKA
ncbi:NAD(P)/FAD-dependent oxidoreductase [Paenimyroides aestuarii]|uniref:NAD(P)/FAD-dependent oxidoreductase n=1 Tax=Paenimyroides aestuarii TaxID=2968490 RepID=A0ABY5NVK5_9FLAO|nr:NAD(P)/FAD-dependent oxidoreductase [Paenimyroides aestuarii]UUV22498.1 NAD(P)/FAD-dependent oxidoreductase [Paenimyroides aestuarii]